jgi:hypothetical protein
VVSEPLNDLPGAFIEVPESTVAVLDDSGYHHHPFPGQRSIAPQSGGPIFSYSVKRRQPLNRS